MDWKQFWETKAHSGGPALQVGRVIGGVVLDDAWMAKIAARIAVQLDLKQEDNLLDVCCGNGALSRALLPYCHHMVGIDFSENLIKQAQSFESNSITNSTNTSSSNSFTNKAFVARDTPFTPLTALTNNQENDLNVSPKNASVGNEDLNKIHTDFTPQNYSNNNTNNPLQLEPKTQENELRVSPKNAGEGNEDLNKIHTDFNPQNYLNNNANNPLQAEPKTQENELGSNRKNDEMNLRQELMDVRVGAMEESEKGTINYVCGDASNFEVAERFEKICLYFSFQYFESQDKGMEVIANLVKHAKPGARILLGDIPDQRKFFVYYNSPRKMSSWLKQSVTGKNDMGKFWHPDELLKICNSLGVKAYVQEQEPWQPYAKYRFDLLIEVGA
jgi:2-polyprenyl-3-methyl-5-hydroxy-6-metoxy-1,4-benzoquinol methylase